MSKSFDANRVRLVAVRQHVERRAWKLVTEQDPPALVSHVSTERRRNAFGDVGVIPNIEEVSCHGCVRVVGMRMNRRHFNNNKGWLGQTNKLNLRLDEERSGRRGFNRQNTAKIVNIHDTFAQTRHCEFHSLNLKGSHGSFVCLEVPNKSDQVAILGDVSAVGTRKRGQVAFNIRCTLH